jgi:hypothetical protein|tara:strand:- start:1245 stop:1373 length:129 start_codon:yes stop_codon:yes gene_type:complete
MPAEKPVTVLGKHVVHAVEKTSRNESKQQDTPPCAPKLASDA